MADARGLVSQALANLQGVSDQLAALDGLPPTADASRSAVEQSIATLIPVVQGATRSVLSFVDAAQPLTTRAKAALEAGDAQGTVDALNAIRQASPPAQASVAATTDAIQATMSDVNTQLVALDKAEGALQQQISQAENELKGEQANAADLDKKKYYWLMLGPFGLIGLGICIGMIVDATNKVNALLQQASALNAQVAQWSKMKADIDLVKSDLPQLAAKLQALKNGIDFISSDTTEVLADIYKAGSGSAIAKAYIMTAEAELATLRSDAS